MVALTVFEYKFRYKAKLNNYMYPFTGGRGALSLIISESL
jgi:hypothetical protein